MVGGKLNKKFYSKLSKEVKALETYKMGVYIFSIRNGLNIVG